MRTLQRTAAVLVFPAMVAACDRTNDTPTESAGRSSAAASPSYTLTGGGGGGGSEGFLLGGTAVLAQDPENPANEVIRIRTDIYPNYGTVSRKVNVKVNSLDNMLEFKAWFQTPKTCIGGSPRIQLAIDLDGNGVSDGNAFGYFGTNPSFTGCVMQTGLYEDLTGGDGITGLGLLPSPPQSTLNEEVEWDLSQFVCAPGGMDTLLPTLPEPCIPNAPVGYTNWSTVETLISALPNHLVCTVALVDDTFGAPGMTGTAYYDLFSAGRATWTDGSDIAGRGFAQGCARIDNDDDHPKDHDHDKDHDRDDDDDRYDRDRRSHH